MIFRIYLLELLYLTTWEHLMYSYAVLFVFRSDLEHLIYSEQDTADKKTRKDKKAKLKQLNGFYITSFIISPFVV